MASGTSNKIKTKHKHASQDYRQKIKLFHMIIELKTKKYFFFITVQYKILDLIKRDTPIFQQLKIFTKK